MSGIGSDDWVTRQPERTSFALWEYRDGAGERGDYADVELRRKVVVN